MDNARDNALSSRKSFNLDATDVPGECGADSSLGSVAGLHWKRFVAYQTSAKKSASRLFRTRSVLGILLAFFSRNALNVVYSFYVPLYYQEDLNLPSWVSYIVVGTMDNILGLFLTIPIGCMSEFRLLPVRCFPRRVPWVFGGVVMAAVGFVMVVATSTVGIVFVACFVHVLGRQLRGPPMYAVLGDQFSFSQRPLMHALNTTTSALGMTVCFVLAGAISAFKVHYVFIFIPVAIAPVVAVTLYALIMRERARPLKKQFVLELARSENLLLLCMRTTESKEAVRLVVRRDGLEKGDASSDVLLATSSGDVHEGIRFVLTGVAQEAGWSLGGSAFSPSQMTLGVESYEIMKKAEAANEDEYEDDVDSHNEVDVMESSSSSPHRSSSSNNIEADIRGWSALASLFHAAIGASLFEVGISSFAVIDLGLEESVATAALLLFAAFYIGSLVLIAIVSRYLGRANVLVCGLAGLAVLCIVGNALIVDLMSFLVFLVLAGIFVAMTVANYLPLIFDAVKNGNFGRHAGYYSFSLSIAGICGPVAGAIQVARENTHRVLFPLTAGSLVLAIFWLSPIYIARAYFCLRKRTEARQVSRVHRCTEEAT